MKKFITVLSICFLSIGLWDCKKDNSPTAPPIDPELIVTNMMASSTNVALSNTITLTATVHNLGGRSSATTTLRWYLSTNSTIDINDTEVGTNVLSSLRAGGRITETISITVPTTVGTYTYYACVDPVTNEYYTNNNCSSAVRGRRIYPPSSAHQHLHHPLWCRQS